MESTGQTKIGCLDTSQEINMGMEEEIPNLKGEINCLKMRGEINYFKMKEVILVLGPRNSLVSLKTQGSIESKIRRN